jgi:cytochrome c biogenesis protein CcmG/thiol:disulfide interchange protein DsbE
MSNTEVNNDSQAEEPRADEGWKPRDIIIAIVLFLLIIALAIGGYFIYEHNKKPPLIEGDDAPDFTLPLLGGGETTLSDYRGKVVLINIWATWCEPCREEMPYIENQYQNLKDRPFEILAISEDKRGEEDVGPFVQEFGLSFPILLDENKDIGELYQTSKFPESFIIDKDGIIVSHVVGGLGSQDFQLIDHLVGQ